MRPAGIAPLAALALALPGVAAAHTQGASLRTAPTCRQAIPLADRYARHWIGDLRQPPVRSSHSSRKSCRRGETHATLNYRVSDPWLDATLPVYVNWHHHHLHVWSTGVWVDLT